MILKYSTIDRLPQRIHTHLIYNIISADVYAFVRNTILPIKRELLNIIELQFLIDSFQRNSIPDRSSCLKHSVKFQLHINNTQSCIKNFLNKRIFPMKYVAHSDDNIFIHL